MYDYQTDAGVARRIARQEKRVQPVSFLGYGTLGAYVPHSDTFLRLSNDTTTMNTGMQDWVDAHEKGHQWQNYSNQLTGDYITDEVHADRMAMWQHGYHPMPSRLGGPWDAENIKFPNSRELYRRMTGNDTTSPYLPGMSSPQPSYLADDYKKAA